MADSTPKLSMVAELEGETLQVSWEAPRGVEPSLAERDTVSPSEREKTEGWMIRLPFGSEVGESVTTTGSDPPPEQAVSKMARRAERPRGKKDICLGMEEVTARL